jgi:ketosteroid isomerase-like protein
VAATRPELVHALFARWNAGDRDFDHLDFHPDVEIHSQLAELQGHPYRGLDGVHQWMSDLDEAFGRFQLDVDEVLEIGNRVLALGTIDIRGRSGETEFRRDISWLVEFAGDVIVRFQTFRSHAEGRAAAELEP